MNHTKEPWEVREFPDGSDCFVTAKKEGKMAYGPEIMGDDYTGYGDYERKKADAKRIVACVNACAGITDAVIEDGIIKKALIAYLGSYDKSVTWNSMKVWEDD
ncbi:MAG: hypothetical protein WC992_08955 [Acholeplasmataceae bacterium]